MNAKSKSARLLSSVAATALSAGILFSFAAGASADITAQVTPSNAASPAAPAQVSTFGSPAFSVNVVDPAAPGIAPKNKNFRVKVADSQHATCADANAGCKEDQYYVSGLPGGWTVSGAVNHGPADDGTTLWQVRGDDARGERASGLTVTAPANWTGQMPIKVWRADTSQNLITVFDNGTFDYKGQIPSANTVDSSGKKLGDLLPNYQYHDPRTPAVATQSVDGGLKAGDYTGQWAPHDGQFSVWPTALMTGPYGVWPPNTIPWITQVKVGSNVAATGQTWNNQWADLRSVQTNAPGSIPGLSLANFPSSRLWGGAGSVMDRGLGQYDNSFIPNDGQRLPLGVHHGNLSNFSIDSSSINDTTKSIKGSPIIPDSCMKNAPTYGDITPSIICPDSSSNSADMGNDDTIKNSGKFLIVNGRDMSWGTDTIVDTGDITPPASDGNLFVFRASLANVLYTSAGQPVQLSVAMNDTAMNTLGSSTPQSGWQNSSTHWTSMSSIINRGANGSFHLKIRNGSQAGYGNDFAIDNLSLSPLVPTTAYLRAIDWTASKTANPPSGAVVKRGQTITYMLTVTNNSEPDRHKIAAPSTECNPATGQCVDAHTMPLMGAVTIDDLSGVVADGKGEYVGNISGPGSASYDANAKKLTWKLPIVPAGSSISLTYQVKAVNMPPAPTTLENSVIALPYGDPDNPVKNLPPTDNNWWNMPGITPNPAQCQKGSPCKTDHYISAVSWQKIASQSKQSLAGSEWTLTGPDLIDTNGNKVPSLTIKDCTPTWCDGPDKNSAAGAFRLIGMFGTGNNSSDTNYSLVESRAPSGYKLDQMPHVFTIHFGKQEDLTVAGSPFGNQQLNGPNLPLTGGTPADAIVLGGFAAVALAALSAAITTRRRHLARKSSERNS
jgi:hypothetical protein